MYVHLNFPQMSIEPIDTSDMHNLLELEKTKHSSYQLRDIRSIEFRWITITDRTLTTR